MDNAQKVVYTTRNYQVAVCSIQEPNDGGDLEVYGIFNRDTGVREGELRALPHAIMWTDQTQQALDDLHRQRAQADAEQALVEQAFEEKQQELPMLPPLDEEEDVSLDSLLEDSIEESTEEE